MISDTTSTPQKQIHRLNKNFSWKTLSIEMPRARFGHCMVSIDDNQIALIGGRPDFNNLRIAEIDIYNFDTQMWSPGPE